MPTALIRLTTGVVYARSISGTLEFSSGGVLELADGSATAPSLTFDSDTNTGLYWVAADELNVAVGGEAFLSLDEDNNIVGMQSGALLGWTSSATDATAAQDLIILRDDANTYAQRNGTTTQVWRLYNQYTSATNYSRVALNFASNIFAITGETGASGTDVDLRLRAAGTRKLLFGNGGVDRWEVDGSGNLIATTDNDIDIGLSGATRPRSIFTGTDVNVGAALILGGVAAGATTRRSVVKKVTGIADNTATDVFTVTIPNANHAAAIRLQFLSSNGSTDAFESSRCASGHVVVARTSGANAVTTAAAIDDAAIATVAAGATHLLTYGVSAVAGAAGASNTFTIQVTIDDSGNLGSNQVVAVAELLNSEATGITIA